MTNNTGGLDSAVGQRLMQRDGASPAGRSERAADSSPQQRACPPPDPMPASIATSIATLPTDLLARVFAFIAVRPLLLIVSVVCKPWRTAAQLSVTSVSIAQPYHASISLFPRLAHLYVHSFNDPVPDTPLRLPPTLRQLFASSSMLTWLRSASIPPLTDLTLVLCTAQDFDAAVPLLAACVKSLTSLTIDPLAEQTLTYREFLSRVHFPALRHLRHMHYEERPDTTLYRTFLARHAAQLNSLDCSVSVITEPAFGLTYDNLHTLSIGTVTKGHPQRVHEVVPVFACAPKLTRLVPLDYRCLLPPPLPPVCAAAIRDLDLEGAEEGLCSDYLRMLVPELPNLTAIENLSIESSRLCEFTGVGFATKLRSLTLVANRDTPLASLLRFSNLRDLCFKSGSTIPAPTPHHTLPSLESLGVYNVASEPALLLDCVEAYLHSCPRLRRLALYPAQPLPAACSGRLRALLAQLARRHCPVLNASVDEECRTAFVRGACV